MRCDNPEQVEKTLQQMIDMQGPVLVDMVVDPNENVYPMIPGGAAHYEMELAPGDKVEVDENEIKLQA